MQRLPFPLVLVRVQGRQRGQETKAGSEWTDGGRQRVDPLHQHGGTDTGEAGQDQGCSSGLWDNTEGGCRGGPSCSMPGARHRGSPGKEVLNECMH